MNDYTIAIFGEAQKGRSRTAYYFDALPQIIDYLGEPPPDSRGLYYAVQALMFRKKVIFFRVEHEGFSNEDYFGGLYWLERKKIIENIAAICLPGVGDSEIFDAAIPILKVHHSILITTEPDLYDFLTHLRFNL